jgi:WD40 repeat protein
LRLWNTATRQIVIEFPLEQPCPGLAFSQDGRTLVTSTSGPGGRGTTTLLRIPDGAKTASYPSSQSGQNTSTDFLVSPDLSLAASGLPGGRVCLTDLRSGKELWNASAAKEFVTALALSPDQKTLATAAGFSESDIRLWDVVTGKETGRLEGHSGWVGALVFWPDGKRLASSSADQTIRIWDLGTRTCMDILRGHRNEVWRLVLLPDQRTLISGSKDGAVCVWDTSAPHPRRGNLLWKEQIAGWRFSPDSRSILTVNQQGEVARWSGVDFQAKEPLLQIPVDAIPAGTLREYLAFSGDGQFLARGSLDGGVSVFNVAQRALWREFKTAAGRVVPMAFLGRGNRLFGMRNTDNHLFEWDLVANREIQSWPAPRQDNSFGVSPDERLVVSAGWKGDFNFRDLPGRKSTTPRLDILEPYDAAFAPSGKLLVMGSLLGYARVWDTVTWQEVATLRGFRNACSSVVFSPDGNRIITGGGSEVEALKLWAVDSWQELFTLTTPGAGFRGVTFSPDGNALGVLSLGMLHVWQAPSWEEINAAEAKEKADSKQP